MVRLSKTPYPDSTVIEQLISPRMVWASSTHADLKLGRSQAPMGVLSFSPLVLLTCFPICSQPPEVQSQDVLVKATLGGLRMPAPKDTAKAPSSALMPGTQSDFSASQVLPNSFSTLSTCL